MFCLKTLKKVPMAAVGMIDLIACASEKAICMLAKRGEKAVKCMREKHHVKEPCCSCDAETACEHP
ncbi:MAG: hypothetical protein IKW00_00050 [Clostridia bacterium]|nr:hypothetical protein [Clostridia bacterium]